MPANFDGTSAEIQPDKNKEDINNRKNKENTSNEEEISEKEKQTEQRKNKSLTECPLTDHQRAIQAEDSEWTLMFSNKKKNTQRPLMEGFLTGNLINDITEEEIFPFLVLGGTTYLRESSLARKQCTGNWRFAGCIHLRMPQKFIETVLKINGLSFKNRHLVIQLLTEMMKLHLNGKTTLRSSLLLG